MKDLYDIGEKPDIGSTGFSYEDTDKPGSTPVEGGSVFGSILGGLLGTRDTYTEQQSTGATIALGLVLVAALAVLVWAVNGFKVKR